MVGQLAYGFQALLQFRKYEVNFLIIPLVPTGLFAG
jgi:hypothetical protein